MATACLENSTTDPPRSVSIQLTAAQAATLNSRIQAIVTSSSDVAWLADSANLGLKAGAVVDSAELGLNIGGGPFYAVSLQRHFFQTTNPYATFDVIYFNDPSNPTRFVILSVFARGQVGPPDGVLANIATPTAVLIANAHVYAIDGQAVTHWRATQGSMVMGNAIQGGGCPAFTEPGNVKCEQAQLLIGAEVTASTRESGTAPGSPTITIENGLVSGIKLIFQVF